ncbi:hypothetical protein [Alicyclobacillus dauci]|uniref:Uncharacterized protein n=1 Tax=Alicyclobacillus dauci TaxID=1475485 RepID=A0ABY6YYJ1_9BACL|nr:hypothetical protein [Alicyclobacillus dauci]WAH35051.1 hypothetical protein NZD86_12000 [Alicyclobacillus dauci]
MSILLWIIIFLVIVIGGAVIFGFLSAKSDVKFLQSNGYPKNTPSLQYLSGQPGISPGFVFAVRQGTNLVLFNTKGNKAEIPIQSIVSIDVQLDVQTVNTGGGRSIAGAVVGEAIAGPVGAVVGGTKGTKTENIDRSTVRMRVRSDNGIEHDIVFKGSHKTHNVLLHLIS